MDYSGSNSQKSTRGLLQGGGKIWILFSSGKNNILQMFAASD